MTYSLATIEMEMKNRTNKWDELAENSSANQKKEREREREIVEAKKRKKKEINKRNDIKMIRRVS